MLETGAKGVREHIEIVKRVMVFSPNWAKSWRPRSPMASSGGRVGRLY